MSADSLIAALSSGPRTTSDLVTACGYEADDPRGRSYVTTTLHRLSRRGWQFLNLNPRGSQRGALYVLTGRPPREAVPAGERNHCLRCGIVLAGDHGRDAYCSPCERHVLEAGLVQATQESLFEGAMA